MKMNININKDTAKGLEKPRHSRDGEQSSSLVAIAIVIDLPLPHLFLQEQLTRVTRACTELNPHSIVKDVMLSTIMGEKTITLVQYLWGMTND